jgi:hypothetical protein
MIFLGLIVFVLVMAIVAEAVSRRPRKPRTDAEHGTRVDHAARALNAALADARAAGLNPKVKVAPLDDELPRDARPFVGEVERLT